MPILTCLDHTKGYLLSHASSFCIYEIISFLLENVKGSVHCDAKHDLLLCYQYFSLIPLCLMLLSENINMVTDNVFLNTFSWLTGGCNIEGEDDSWDFGSGAGFYVDATEEKWKKNYRMYSYVTQELPAIIAANFKVKSDKAAIMGHR